MPDDQKDSRCQMLGRDAGICKKKNPSVYEVKNDSIWRKLDFNQEKKHLIQDLFPLPFASRFRP
jgi:hypothetical protein